MKQYERAFDAGQSLQLARQYGLDMDVCNNSCTLADVLISMGKLDEAEVCLRETMSGYMHGSSVAHVYVLKSVGYLRLLRIICGVRFLCGPGTGAGSKAGPTCRAGDLL